MSRPRLSRMVTGMPADFRMHWNVSTRSCAGRRNGMAGASFKGNLRQRYLEAKVMEMLCLLVDTVESRDE